MHSFPMTINGRPVQAASHFDVKNPATGQVIGQAPNATNEDLDSAVAAAQKAFGAWSRQSDEHLQTACHAVVSKMNAHAEELATLVTLEQGKPLNGMGSRWELGGASAWASYTASLTLPLQRLQDNDQGRVDLYRRPLGVVGSITPWNFPVMIAVWHLLPALRTGNTVVIKPSPYTPLSTLRLVELLAEVLPPGVLNCVAGDDGASRIGAAMSSHPGIRKIVFTGSISTGRQVMQSAAATMKRLTLELGGNDAGIVLPDCDPKAIAEGLFWGSFVNSGQTCAAMKRLYVHDSLHDDVCRHLLSFAKTVPMGEGMQESSLLGPVQNRMQFDTVNRLVEDSRKHGEVLLGGEPGGGLFYPATLVAGLNNGHALVDQEQFGPALPIIRYSDVSVAIRDANDSPNGLGGSVWSRDIDEARHVAAQLECGSVWINKHGAIQPNAPFGGTKQSGMGVEFAEDGLLEYTDRQVIFS